MMPDPSAIPVAVTSSGFTWTAAGAWGTFLAVVGLIIKQVGPWRKLTNDATDKLIAQLTDRLEKVENLLQTERKLNYIQNARLEARHEAQRALDRHRLRNRDQCLIGLLHALELSPSKAKEAAKMYQEQLQKDKRNEQLEAAEIHKAEIIAIENAERELTEVEEQKS